MVPSDWYLFKDLLIKIVYGIDLQMDPKFLRNQRYAKKHNKRPGAVEAEE